MDISLIVLVSLLVAAFALGFYMDWFGLWVSEEEMRKEKDRAKDRRQALGCRFEHAGAGEPATEPGFGLIELETGVVGARWVLHHGGGPMPHRSKAVIFDLDAVSLTSLREALPEWEIETMIEATAGSLEHHWNPGAADLLVVKARADIAETLGLCRFLASCSAYSADSRKQQAEFSGPGKGAAERADAPLLVLVSPGQGLFVNAVLDAGAACCLVLPIHAREVARMVVRGRQGSRPGLHTLDLDQPQGEDPWRDDGGQG